jgi:hypothetical protein
LGFARWLKANLPGLGSFRQSRICGGALVGKRSRWTTSGPRSSNYAATNGYYILRWFQDDGISGHSTERRDGFLAFHKAACNGRDFDAVLVWDQDRFGRFDSMEAGSWIHRLRKAGVRLVSVTEEPINWDDFTGRVSCDGGQLRQADGQDYYA